MSNIIKLQETISKNSQIFSYQSRTLNRKKLFSATFPTDYFTSKEEFPLLIFLHGMGRDHTTIISNQGLREIFESAPFVTIFPEGDNAFYINSQVKEESRYEDFLSELIEIVNQNFNVLLSEENRAIGGWSMGSFGAANYLMSHQGSFSTYVSIIGLLDYPNSKYDKEDNFEVIDVFPQDENMWVKYQAASNAKLFKNLNILIYSGDKAFDTKMNRSFHNALEDNGIEHVYIEEPGEHVWPTVQNAIPYAINYCREKLIKVKLKRKTY